MFLAQELYLNFPWNGVGFVLLSGKVSEHTFIVSFFTVAIEVNMNDIYHGCIRRGR